MKTQHTFGHFVWAKQNQGRITWSEKISMINKSLLPTLQHLRYQFLSPKNVTTLAFDQVIIPDTAYIQDAVCYVEQDLSPSVLAHSWRCYYWGYALAQQRQISFDTETFLLSCLFHDTGLGKDHPQGCQCFTLHGALIAQQWAERQQYPHDKIHIILDSICLHMNGAETPQYAPEVRLLQWGTSCDVIGQHIQHIAKPYQKHVWQHFPVQQFYQEMQHAIAYESRHYPQSRTAVLKQLGLPILMKYFANKVQS